MRRPAPAIVVHTSSECAPLKGCRYTVPSECVAIISGMATALQTVGPSSVAITPRVVLSGSFRRDPVGLRAAFAGLKDAACDVIAPTSVDFVGDVGGFAVTAEQEDMDPALIEAGHVEAVRRADFVWLHAPGGYVGPSAALEVGVAYSAGVPVWATEMLQDVALGQFVRVASSLAAAVHEVRAAGLRTPAEPLRDLQTYYERVAASRGFDSESPQDAMLLLTEEVGELARAIRKTVGLARATSDNADPAEELADVQLYILHLANVVGVDLASAVRLKEEVNHERYTQRVAA